MLEKLTTPEPVQLEDKKNERLDRRDTFDLPKIDELPIIDGIGRKNPWDLPTIDDFPSIDGTDRKDPWDFSKNIDDLTSIDGIDKKFISIDNPYLVDVQIPEPFLVVFEYLPTTGSWEGDEGNSTWKPDPDKTPDPENKKGGNPDGLTWEQILEKYGIDGIEYIDGYPDFSPITEAQVEVEPFTESRDKNFRQADEKLAEQWTAEGKDGKEWTARDVAEWRKENGYTWHECQDCKTMQLVPKEVHNNTPHAGGISEIKKQQAEA